MTPGSDSADIRGQLRFDGFYIAKRNDMFGLLRFYENGDVLYASVMGPPSAIEKQVVKWFKRGHKAVAAGKYEVDGERVTFSATTPFGPTDYDGILQAGGGITIQWKLKGKPRKGPDDYSFIEAPLP